MASKPGIVSGTSGAEKPRGWHRPVMSRDERTVREGLLAYEAERGRVVAKLKAAVWAGDYDPDPDDVAEAMLAERETGWRTLREEEKAFTPVGP